MRGMSIQPLSSKDVRAAALRIAGFVHHTPVATCGTLDRLAGRALFFKSEHLQKVGAFKFRGATNALLQLDDEACRRGVVTHSSGNHAQALALAARLRGTQAHIVMPTSACAVKRAAVVSYGARVVLCEPTLKARETAAEAVIAETGATFVHPYDHPWIIAGQGTAALELFADVPDLDAVIAPVGGGGLLAGTCLAAQVQRRPGSPPPRIFGAEPRGADDCARSIAAGKLIPQERPDTIADGLLTSLGDQTWPILREHLAGVLVVDDEAIVDAMRLLWERAKLLVEPSAAVAFAAVLDASRYFEAQGIRRLGVILSGGNVDLDRLPF